MNDKQFEQMMQNLIGAEEQKLQVGSSSFIRRDRELMEMIDRAREGATNDKERRKREKSKNWGIL